ncbi:carboxypeptidase-like regulatory domain-containing protein [Rufibacter roseolus]|uniref:carboxypeptidase-like regulatory domain-containing protein n=1 Tax=Rufibacter roseolus TaxID=2817375 RepID=UPI001B30222C|nr:carboxypeptidase-like regulatory domain-containing protein [Rufibacter roseolus]
MPTRRLTVTIPQPCHEDWASMTPLNQGRFCQNCQKTVVDFTMMSDVEVVDWLGKENTCGRFRSNQLGRELTALPVPSRKWDWRPALLGLFAWFSSKTAEAQTSNASIPAQDRAQALPSIIRDSTITPSSVYRGIIVDSISLEPIPGVTVRVAGTSIAKPTGVHGEFEIVLPEGTGTENLSLVVSFIGYMTETIPLKESNSQASNEIRLRLDRASLVEVVVVAGNVQLVRNPPVQQNKPQLNFFQRLKEKLF